MSYRFLRLIGVCLLCAFCTLVSVPAFAGWTVTVLHPAEYEWSTCLGVGGDKQVGFIDPYIGEQHAVVWSGTAESYLDLHPAGYKFSAAYGVSDSYIVGRVATIENPADHAALWDGNAEGFIDLNPTGCSDSWAYGVSAGQQVGHIVGSGDTGTHAAIWNGTPESVVDVHPLGWLASNIFAVSDGEQAGYALNESSTSHAAVWNGTAESFVDLNPVNSYRSEACGTSEGRQAGYVYGTLTGLLMHAALWSGTPESFVDLNPSEWSVSRAFAICGPVQVGYVKMSGTYDPTNAALWKGTSESFINLHSLLSADYVGSRANGVEITGDVIQVVGGAWKDPSGNTYAAMMWTYTPPVVTITSPTSADTYDTSSDTISIAGTASASEGSSITWSNDRGGSGSCTGIDSWSAEDIALFEGQNVITVTVTENDGSQSTDTLIITKTLPVVPVVTISIPTSADTFTAAKNNLPVFAGTASSENGSITLVEWSNSLGGSGVCKGTESWNYRKLPLLQGENVITVTATDSTGAQGTDVLTVTYGTAPDPDPDQPISVKIMKPTQKDSYTSRKQVVPVSGIANPTTGSTLTQVTWSNDRGGSGVCSGTATWSVDGGVTLQPGLNVITVTACDDSGEQATDVMNVTY